MSSSLREHFGKNRLIKSKGVECDRTRVSAEFLFECRLKINEYYNHAFCLISEFPSGLLLISFYLSGDISHVLLESLMKMWPGFWVTRSGYPAYLVVWPSKTSSASKQLKEFSPRAETHCQKTENYPG